jgi:hypothetical protein
VSYFWLSEFIQYFGTHFLGKNVYDFQGKIRITRYLFFYCDLFVITLCRCRGLLLHMVTFNDTHTQTHTHTRTHTHSVGLLWKRYRPVEETSIWQHTTLTTDNIYIYAPCRIRTHQPSKWAAADPLDSLATSKYYKFWEKMFISTSKIVWNN